MCYATNTHGFNVGDKVVLKNNSGTPFSAGEVLTVTDTFTDSVDVGTEDGRWASAWNEEVERAPAIAANGVGPGAGPGARLAATLRALGKKWKTL